MPGTLPATCRTALKEWATVLTAMSKGEQFVLIRKGGLVELGSGFELITDTFVLYPTFEHQAVSYLRPEFRGYFDEAATRRAPNGQVQFVLAGVAVSWVKSQDAAIIDRLSAFHIYNQDFQTQRLKWQPEQPLLIAVIRAFRLPEPVVMPVVDRYAGCKSWVELDVPVPLAGATPVLDDAAFQQRLRGLVPLLGV